MHLTVNSQHLAEELRLLAKIAPSKPAIPILSHVLLTATDELRLHATDMEVALSTSCPARVEMPGTVALPVVKLLAMVEQFADGDVIVKVESKSHVTVKCNAFTTRMQALPTTDFPSVPDAEGSGSSLDAEALRALIAKTRYAINATGSNYLLKGALLTLSGSTALMVATDSRRLALAMAGRTGSDGRLIIPAKTLDILAGQTDLGDLELTVGVRHLFFQLGKRLLTSRTIDGEYPKYERIIPSQDVNKNVVSVSRASLTSAIRRVKLASETNRAMYFDISADAMTLTSSSAEVGTAHEPVAVTYDGPAMKVCLNGDYVLDFLEAAAAGTVSMALKDATSAVLFSDGDDHLAVIMSMKG